MENKDLQKEYIEHLNELLITVDFKKLDMSCNSTDDTYAKDILKKMHDIFVDVYQSDYLDSYTYDFVEVPAIIRGRDTGHIGLGILSLDLESSG